LRSRFAKPVYAALNSISGGSAISHRFDNLFFGGGSPDGFLIAREEISRGAV
jgi:hypothetical protein